MTNFVKDLSQGEIKTNRLLKVTENLPKLFDYMHNYHTNYHMYASDSDNIRMITSV